MIQTLSFVITYEMNFLISYVFVINFLRFIKIIIKEKYSGGGSDQREDEQFEFMQDRLA